MRPRRLSPRCGRPSRYWSRLALPISLRSALETATSYLVEAEAAQAAAGSVPYLTLLGTVCAGWLMARLSLAAERRGAADGGNLAFHRAKLATARFYAEHFLALAPGYVPGVVGGRTVCDFDPGQF